MDTIIARPSKIRLLTREEELDLARRAKAGDQDAAKVLVERNLRLVFKLASRYGRRLENRAKADIDDLIQEEAIGLMTAVRKFDPERGVKFATYATWWVRQAIWRTIRRAKPSRQEGDGLPTSLDIDNLADPRSLPVDEVDAEHILQFCRYLPASWQSIVQWHFGLAGQEPLSLKESATRFGVRRSRVWQFLSKSLRRLQELHQQELEKSSRETEKQTHKAVAQSRN